MYTLRPIGKKYFMKICKYKNKLSVKANLKERQINQPGFCKGNANRGM